MVREFISLCALEFFLLSSRFKLGIRSSLFRHHTPFHLLISTIMSLDSFFHNKIESMKLEIIQGQAVLRRLEAQRNDYNSRVRLLREELGLLQQPGSYVGEVVKVMGTKKVLVKVHPEGKYGMPPIFLATLFFLFKFTC